MGIIDFEFIKVEKIVIKINNKNSKNEDDNNFIKELLDINKDGDLSLIIDLPILCKRFGYFEENDLKKRLKDLEEKKLLNFDVIKKGKIIKLLKDSISDSDKKEYSEKIKEKIKFDRLKLSKVLEYANLENECRRVYLLNYFGEKFDEKNCKKCDICRGTYSNNITFVANDINKNILYFFYLYSGKIGKSKAVKILKGSYDIEPKYKEYPEYGILNSFKIKDIESEINILIKKRFLRLTKNKYPTLKLTEEGEKELKKILKL